MGSRLETLLRLVPAGTAEAERHLLDRTFVEPENLPRLAVPQPFSPLLLIGKKGSGKTALLDAVALLVVSAGVPVVRLAPSDIELSNSTGDQSVAAHTRVAYQALVLSIASKQGSDLRGLVTGSDKDLLDAALATGAADSDTISRLARLLPRLAQPVTNIDLSGVLPESKAINLQRVHQAVLSKLNEAPSSLYVLIDDTDQVADPTDPQHLNRIWGLLLAARKLAADSERLRVVVSIREEVWRRLLREGAGQRDQADHFDKLVRFLAPNSDEVKRILRKRLEQAAADLGETDAEPWVPFFVGAGARIPTSSEFSGWMDLIVSRSRGRPRDAIQFLHGLASTADLRGAERIEQSDLDLEIRRFSDKRVGYLKNEAEAECPQIEKIVDGLAKLEFDQGSFKSSFEKVRAWLRVQATEGVQVLGKRLSPTSDEDLLSLLRLLYDLDVLNARVSDVREKDGYRHLRPQERPDLVQIARWSELQGIVWEVNPAFRDHIVSIQAANAAKFGLARQRKRPRRRR